MKINEQIKEIISGICERPYPSVVDINLTTRCNHKCIYCEIGQGLIKSDNSDKKQLSLDDIKWIIDQMDSAHIPNLVLLGGEPFLFRDLFKVVDYASKYIKDISIITNGMQIPKLSSEELMNLKTSNCNVIVSLDSFHSETHNMIRGVPNAFENAVQAIKILVQSNIPVRIETVISRYNYMDLSEIVKNAYSLGVSAVTFVPIITSSNFPTVHEIPQKKDLNPNPDNIERLSQEFDKILAFEREHAIQTNVRGIHNWIAPYITYHSASNTEGDLFFNYCLKRYFCWTLYHRIKINAYGDVQPCNLIPSTVSIYDRTDRSLVQQWNMSCQQIRDLIKEQAYPWECHGCYSSHTTNVILSSIKYPFENRENIGRLFLDQLQRVKETVWRNETTNLLTKK